MVQSLFQLQNDQIIVSKENKIYIDALDNFNRDYKNDFTKSFKQIIYNQTLQIYVLNDVMQEGRINFELDKVINSIDVLLEKQAKRQAVVQQPPTIVDRTNSIKSKYERQILELKDSLATATLANDNTSIEELKKEYAELMKKYESELEELNNAEKV